MQVQERNACFFISKRFILIMKKFFDMFTKHTSSTPFPS